MGFFRFLEKKNKILFLFKKKPRKTQKNRWFVYFWKNPGFSQPWFKQFAREA